MLNFNNKFTVISLYIFILFVYCSKDKVETNTKIQNSQDIESIEEKQKDVSENKSEYKVTFIELGSVNCIPCRMMQPIMKEIESEYKDKVKVVFYDVWTEEGRPYAMKHKIRVIPTQVFLDKDSKEYFRHEGYFPKNELVKILKMKGVE